MFLKSSTRSTTRQMIWHHLMDLFTVIVKEDSIELRFSRVIDLMYQQKDEVTLH